eukprot:gene7602-9867_t
MKVSQFAEEVDVSGYGKQMGEWDTWASLENEEEA